MFKLIRLLLWSALFLVSIIVVDQALIHIRLDIPGVRQGQDFYVDFRARLLALTAGKAPDTIESAIEASSEGIGATVRKAIDKIQESGNKKEVTNVTESVQSAGPNNSETTPNQSQGSQGIEHPKKMKYVYADEANNLQFADSLDDVPLKFRKDAQPLKE